MRISPSIVPLDDDQDVYLVLDDFGRQLGLAWRETDPSDAKLETVITDLMEGSTKTRSASSPSTPPNAGRKTSPRTWPARSGGASTYSFPMCLQGCKTLSSGTNATIGSSRCGWPKNRYAGKSPMEQKIYVEAKQRASLRDRSSTLHS